MGKKKTDEGLPYLKFFPLKWITGDIADCSLAAQGLFISICALYWSKQGKLSFDAMKRKFPRKSKLFNELLERGILKSNEDDIVITFLDEQLAERGLVSEQNRNAAKQRWNQNKSDANALQPHSERIANAMPEEEKREEEKREEEKETRARQVVIEVVPRGTDSVENLLTDILADEGYRIMIEKNFPGADLAKSFRECWTYHSAGPSPPEYIWQWRQKFTTWLSIERQRKQPNERTTRTLESTGPQPGKDYSGGF